MASDRIVKVVLTAQMQSYIDGMKKAATATAEVGTQGEKLAQQREAFNTLGRSGVIMGGLIAAGITVAVAKFAEFDQAMSNVKAATGETASNMALLRDAALEAGARTVYSATESAGAIEELGKAGLSTKDILNGGLNGALDLAAAGGLDVASAAAIAATTLNQFGLKGTDAAHVADLLAAGAGEAQGDVTDLSSALAQSGLVANQFGLSVDETVGTLSAFASAGLLGSDAGTSFRTMLLRLANPTGEAADKMKELGINAYDAQGQFIGMEGLAGQLQNGLKGLTQEQKNAALAIIFGQDAIRGANVLLTEGADGIQEWTDKVDDQGRAAETAATRLDNLNGDLEKLSGAFDTALIQTGAAANDVLRDMVQTLTGLVDMYNDLPGPVQGGVLAIGAATAAILLAGGAALIAIPKIAEFKLALATTGLSLKGLSLAAGVAGAALGGLFAIVAGLAQAQAEARAKAQAYADTLEQGTRKITASTRDMAKEALAAKNSFLWIEQDSAYDAAEKLGIGLDLVTDAATGNADALKELQAQLLELEDGSFDTANSIVDVENAVRGESESLAEAIEMAEQKQSVDADSVESSNSAAEAYLNTADQAQGLTDTLSSLIDTINEANGVGQDAVSANLAYQDSLAKVDEVIANATAGVEGYALGLDSNTQSGRDNIGMLNDLAADSQTAAEAQFKLDGNTAKYRSTLEQGRQALIDRAIQLGANADEAGALADQIYRIPSSTEWEVIAETAQAQAVVDRFIFTNTGRRINLIVDGVAGRQVAGSDVIARAGGGPVYGPGTGTSDSIPALLSNGEHVWTAAEVAAAGGQGAMYAMRAAVRQGRYMYANGGGVGSSAGSSSVGRAGVVIENFNAYGTREDVLAQNVTKKLGRALVATGALRKGD